MQRFAALFQSVTRSVHITTHPVRDTSRPPMPSIRRCALLAEQTERIPAGRRRNPVDVANRRALQQGVRRSSRCGPRAAASIPTNSPASVAASEGMGGPEIPLDQVHIEGIADPAFTNAYLGAPPSSANSTLAGACASSADHAGERRPFDRTSGFGARVDPFTGRYAFHPGIDFAGPGAPGRATARERSITRATGRIRQYGRNRPWFRN